MGSLGKKLCLDVVETSMGFLLRHASQRLKEATVPVLKQHGLSTLELTTMNLIQANDACILRTLANAVGVEPPAMNRIINSLEEKKLASRYKSASDARYTFFKLTDAGADCLKNASVSVQCAENDVLQPLTDCERQSLLIYLRKFI